MVASEKVLSSQPIYSWAAFVGGHFSFKGSTLKTPLELEYNILMRQFVLESKQKLSFIFRIRLPWLVLGLLGGTVASLVVSRYEEVLSENISLAFFVPIIVYMSDALGTQTEMIFIRELATAKVAFWRYLVKESFVGLVLGLFIGSLTGLIAYVWLSSTAIAMIVGISMVINMGLAPMVALLVTESLYKEHADPAIGSGPFATVIQDVLSLVIYFLVAVAIL